MCFQYSYQLNSHVLLWSCRFADCILSTWLLVLQRTDQHEAVVYRERPGITLLQGDKFKFWAKHTRTIQGPFTPVVHLSSQVQLLSVYMGQVHIDEWWGISNQAFRTLDPEVTVSQSALLPEQVQLSLLTCSFDWIIFWVGSILKYLWVWIIFIDLQSLQPGKSLLHQK